MLLNQLQDMRASAFDESIRLRRDASHLQASRRRQTHGTAASMTIFQDLSRPRAAIARHIKISSCPVPCDRRSGLYDPGKSHGGVGDIGTACGVSRLPAGDTMLEIDPVARRHPQE